MDGDARIRRLCLLVVKVLSDAYETESSDEQEMRLGVALLRVGTEIIFVVSRKIAAAAKFRTLKRIVCIGIQIFDSEKKDIKNGSPLPQKMTRIE